jgi:uncharacterized protein (TIGR02466 family)
MNQKIFKVLELFPSKIGLFDVSEDLSNLETVKNLEYHLTTREGNYNLHRTRTLDLLKQFPAEEKIIIDYFNKFKNDALNLVDTDFYVHKSWAIRINENGYSHSHLHSDSYYVGVIYFDDAEHGGELELSSFGLKPFVIHESLKADSPVFAEEKIVLKPKKNRLLFFPGYIKHAVLPNLTGGNRFSVAFNLLPV